MNARIAKKILRRPLSSPRERQARAYLWRRQTPYRRTRRVLQSMVRWGEEDYEPSIEEIDTALAVWARERPHIRRCLRSGDSYPDGIRVGTAELSERRGSATALVYWSLAYFADRWSLSRLGRIDVFIEDLQEFAHG